MAVKVFDKPGARVRLDAVSADPPKGMTREKAEKRFDEVIARFIGCPFLKVNPR